MVLSDEQIHYLLYKSYLDAREHKRNTLAQLEFEVVCEHDIENLYIEISRRTYIPRPAFCFITYDPVQREVYASQFRDRVVQHFLFNMLNPLFDTLMIHDTYSCRKNKGTLFGIQRYQHHLRSVTDNFRNEAYVLYLDLSGYFMSINKELVIRIIMDEIHKHMDRKSRLGGLWRDHIDPDLILYLLHAILDKNPAENCEKIGDLRNWDGLPDRKKLECSPEGCGIVIGDLTSQLISNILLNVFDQWVKRKLHIRHYGHYVDDMYFMHTSKMFLQNIKPLIEEFLREVIHVKVNPKKWRLLRATDSNTYLGAYVRANYMVPRKRTIDKFVYKLRGIEHFLLNEECPKIERLLNIRATINSYLGLFIHFKSYRLRKNYIENSTALAKYFYFEQDFSKIILRPEFSKIKRGRVVATSSGSKSKIEIVSKLLLIPGDWPDFMPPKESLVRLVSEAFFAAAMNPPVIPLRSADILNTIRLHISMLPLVFANPPFSFISLKDMKEKRINDIIDKINNPFYETIQPISDFWPTGA